VANSFPIRFKPFSKIQAMSQNTSVNFELTDTSGNYVQANYICVAIAGSVNGIGYVEVSLSSINAVNKTFDNNASGTLGGIAVPMEKFEVVLPTPLTCSSITLTQRGTGTGLTGLVIYGVYKEENTLKARSRFGGV
jgi:hypothetical protein